uniref:Pancreatic lipase-related protein 2 n=1 Tax=Myocastor coypus TaxID=10157 RepID=LIPR2_MYOCO|nr:RecName: Full=Pancreatic lipase-related protein 2; Short=PL-RP2; AltName: Full=Cytotoxic T lymphocyte lipase; AltName: Full=Galactolipase; AltName: Full=Triacylglycerol lipase; Flags: Precursor [Myocastor coypus]AAB30219.1 lipase, CoPL-RP2 [Myocastor coypus=coypu, pancrease, Peptide, 470 aa] [Myocastor coypus]CAA58121.1 lipase related protein 2 [Myocastor coypus]prf//2104203C lipase-related protein 2 [Myocastor coypus]
MMLFVWTTGLLLLATARGNEVCYSHLGCFSDEKPWAGTLQRPVKSLPASPESINTRFLLYTNENPNNYQLITATDPATIKASNFNLHRKTRFVIHGFIDNGEKDWLTDICKRMFQVEKVNCICVDWQGGSLAIYSQAVQNIRVVGAEVAYLVQVLSDQLGYKPGNVHMIGHSLGAHTAAEAGRRLKGLVGRITGLDPAEPCFQDTPEEVRLDPSDAMFVDVIHTDIAPIIPSFGFGMSQKVGHMDFFPNGGKEMPGCEKNIISTIVDVNGFLEGITSLAACNHMRSYQYYSSSILNPDGFLGYPCASYEEFQKDGCFPCPAEGCPKMGHYADQFQGKANGVEKTYFLNTGDSDNFPRWRYKVSVTLSGEKELSGDIKIALFGRNGNSKQYEIFKGSLKPDARYTHDIDVDLNVGEIQKVKFLWHNNGINLLQPKLGASQITVQSGEYGTKYNFCSSNTVQEDVLQSLSPC